MNRGIALSPGAVLVLSLIYFSAAYRVSAPFCFPLPSTSLVMRQQSNCAEAK